MSTANKLAKDKTSAPRLTPRPTASSAARAAKNAANRNLANPIPPKSTVRTPIKSLPSKLRTKSSTHTRKSESKPDMKFELPQVIKRTTSLDKFVLPAQPKPVPSENDTFLITDGENNSYEPVNTDQNEGKQQTDNMNRTSEIGPLKSKPGSGSRGKSQPSSQPQTPRASSRPTTPAHPSQRPTTPNSHPTTPLRPKSNTPKSVKVSSANVIVPQNLPQNINKKPLIETDGGDIHKTFNQKQEEFHLLKKELDLKQQTVLSVFDSLRELYEKISQEGTTDGLVACHPEELVVFNVANWTTEEVAQLCKDAVAAACSDGATEIINCCEPIGTEDKCTFSELDEKLHKISSNLAEICLQAFTARHELLDWIKELIANHEDDSGEYVEKISRHNSNGLDLCRTLREVKSNSEEDVYLFTELSKRILRERETLMLVAQTLLRDVALLRQELDKQMNINNEMRGSLTVMAPGLESFKKLEECKLEMRKLEDISRELEEERAAHSALKDKFSTTESQLRQTRIRINKMDRQLLEAESNNATLTGTIKSLEEQNRQREVQLEARARKLRESLKSGEATTGQITQQRDALQAEVNSLTSQIEKITREHSIAIQDLINQQKHIKSLLDEQQNATKLVNDQKAELEAKLADYQHTIEQLNEKITDLENSKPNPDLPTEREMEIWAELQATKDTLSITEEEVTSCKREKVRFLESLSKISENDNKVGLQQKLAAELITKEEIICKMQKQIREVSKNLKLNEQKVIQYEQFVRDVLSHYRVIGSVEETPEGISYQDLQQELINLRMGLLDAVHRNDELSEMLAQKEQILENQDRTSRAQARVIKVREELINMLKNKETEQSQAMVALQQDLEQRMRVVDEVNKQIASKAGEIQGLFQTLENKQQQIHRLEKIVLALEEQQRRAQVQRTRHEEKIATLEHELVGTGKGKGERRFLFF